MTICQWVFEMPHVARNFDIFDLKIRNSGFKMWVPVDQSFAAVNQSFVIHFNKDFDHGIMEIAILIRGGIGGT